MAWRTATALTIGLVGMLAFTAACGGRDDDLPDPPASPTATSAGQPSPTGPALSQEEQVAVDEALEVLDLYLATYVKYAKDPVDPSTTALLEKDAAIAQYGVIYDEFSFSPNEIDRYFARGYRGDGTVEWELVDVVEVDLERMLRDENIPALTVRICVDESNWQAVDASTGQVVEEPRGRYLATVSASYHSDEFSTLRPEAAWRLTEWTDGAESC